MGHYGFQYMDGNTDFDILKGEHNGGKREND